MLSNTRKKQIALLQIHLFIYITLQNGLCLKKNKTNYSIWQNSIEKGEGKKEEEDI